MPLRAPVALPLLFLLSLFVYQAQAEQQPSCPVFLRHDLKEFNGSRVEFSTRLYDCPEVLVQEDQQKWALWERKTYAGKAVYPAKTLWFGHDAEYQTLAAISQYEYYLDMQLSVATTSPVGMAGLFEPDLNAPQVIAGKRCYPARGRCIEAATLGRTEITVELWLTREFPELRQFQRNIPEALKAKASWTVAVMDKLTGEDWAILRRRVQTDSPAGTTVEEWTYLGREQPQPLPAKFTAPLEGYTELDGNMVELESIKQTLKQNFRRFGGYR